MNQVCYSARFTWYHCHQSLLKPGTTFLKILFLKLQVSLPVTGPCPRSGRQKQRRGHYFCKVLIVRHSRHPEVYTAMHPCLSFPAPVPQAISLTPPPSPRHHRSLLLPHLCKPKLFYQIPYCHNIYHDGSTDQTYTDREQHHTTPLICFITDEDHNF